MAENYELLIMFHTVRTGSISMIIILVESVRFGLSRVALNSDDPTDILYSIYRRKTEDFLNN